MPEPVKFLYELGRVTSLDALYLLTSKWSKHGTELAKWLEQYKTKDEIISQITVQNFINTLENKNKDKDKPKPAANETSSASDPIASHFLNGVCRHEPFSSSYINITAFLNGVCRHEPTIQEIKSYS